ncbi:UNVERIFIED_CONTAM: hypothetical protein Scaly_2615200 [Sesamum calycinum]|uniref:Tf2-1-like SH3-like domain-containing protein n=1 Tax=Sesamum calycinum TaxID=2727403 RepID=A0AAW2JEA3_9LAMI
MLEVLRGNLCEAQNRMKAFADKHRREGSFEVGDEVYLKLHPYKQSLVQLRRNMKLAPKYYGPFRILAKVGPSEAMWEDYYDIVARFPDFSMDRGGPDPSLPGDNVTDRCGNSRID